MKRVLFFIFFQAIITSMVMAFSSSSFPDEQTIQITGISASDSLNREDLAKQDAMRKAVEQVAGTQIDSRSLTSYNQLVGTYNYTKLNGFVSKAEPIGLAQETAGVFQQRYAITVVSGDVNLDIVKQGFDVRFLYDVIQRPRMAVYLSDVYDGVRKSFATDYSRETESQLTDYFKEKDRSIVVKNLSFLRRSLDQEIDPIREANRNNFDLLISGETSWRIKDVTRPRKSSNSWGATQNDLSNNPTRKHTVSVQLKWRVVDASNAETVLSFSENYTDEIQSLETDALDHYYAEARQTLLDDAMNLFFVKLLQFWNSRAFEDIYAVNFLGSANDVSTLSNQLRALGSVDPSSVILESVDVRGAFFKLKSTLPRAELVEQLSATFASGHRIGTVRPGKIEFVALQAASQSHLTVTIEGCRLTDLKRLKSTLADLPDVGSVERDSFKNGTAVFSVSTRLSSEEIGLSLESDHPTLQIVDLSEASLKAVIEEDR